MRELWVHRFGRRFRSASIRSETCFRPFHMPAIIAAARFIRDDRETLTESGGELNRDVFRYSRISLGHCLELETVRAFAQASCREL